MDSRQIGPLHSTIVPQMADKSVRSILLCSTDGI